MTVACAPSEAACRGYIAKRAQNRCIKRALRAPALHVPMVFGEVCVACRLSIQLLTARTTGPDFVLRSHGRWAKRTAHGLSLGTMVRSLRRTPLAEVRLRQLSLRVIASLWVGKGNTSRPCATAPRRVEPSSAVASRFPSRRASRPPRVI